MRFARADELIEMADTDGLPAWSIEAFAGGHAKQLECLEAARVNPLLLLRMARQTGKSWFAAGAHIDRAVTRPGSTNLAFGLTGPAVRNVFWESVWKPACSRFALDCRHLDSTMTTKWSNGSRTLMSGTDDVRHIQGVLGGRLDGSLVTIDECQSQPRQVLRALLDVILPPMLTPATTLALLGTFPVVPAGAWYNETKREAYWKRCWGRLDNVHTPEVRQQLDAYLAAMNLPEDDPQIQRDWHGREVYDGNECAYFWLREKNAYAPVVPAWLSSVPVPSGSVFGATPWPGITTFSASIDPGAGDPCGVSVIGWGPGTRVQHVFDWVSERNARHSWSEIMGVCGALKAALGVAHWRYDSNSQNEIDTFGAAYGIPVIQAAKKADMGGQIRRMNDLLRAGMGVIEGSHFEQDCTSARLDQEAFGDGAFKWQSDYHPTASENARYALQAYFEQPAPKPPTAHVDPFDAERAKLERLKQLPRYARGRE